MTEQHIDVISKEEAWAPVENERNEPIDYDAHDFRFTRKWFRSRNQLTFSSFLLDKFDGTKPINVLQIGVFEAMDLVWQLQHTMKHSDSRALGIDPWAATRKLDAGRMSSVCGNATHNLVPYRKKVLLERGYSKEVLDKLIRTGGISIHGKVIHTGEWDLLVIDGDHESDAVYEDAVRCMKLARVGGWLLFDDVRNQIPKKKHVAHGLRRFLGEHGDEVRLVFAHRFVNCYERVA